MNRTRIRLKAALLQLPYQLRDRRQNRRWVKPQPRFLILRHRGKYPYFRDSLLTWLSARTARDSRAVRASTAAASEPRLVCLSRLCSVAAGSGRRLAASTSLEPVAADPG